MSSERKDVEVNLSMASLWPVASYKSAAWSAKIAKEIGCDGIEVLPGWRTVEDFAEKGYLPVEPDFIKSVHDSWKRDRRAEIELHGQQLKEIKRELSDIPIVVEVESLKSVFEAAIGKTPALYCQIVEFIRKA